MENLLEKINSCPITSILDLLGIGYSKHGNNTLALWQDSKETDGWRANISSNYVNDFSKDRSIGGPYSFVKKHLGLTDKETFDWFGTHFGICNNGAIFKKKKKQVSHKLPVIRYLR